MANQYDLERYAAALEQAEAEGDIGTLAQLGISPDPSFIEDEGYVPPSKRPGVHLVTQPDMGQMPEDMLAGRAAKQEKPIEKPKARKEAEPKPWRVVSASKEFKKLNADEQENARRQYFEEVVAPKVPQEFQFEARMQFDRDTAQSVTGLPERGMTGKVADYLSEKTGFGRTEREKIEDARKPEGPGAWTVVGGVVKRAPESMRATGQSGLQAILESPAGPKLAGVAEWMSGGPPEGMGSMATMPGIREKQSQWAAEDAHNNWINLQNRMQEIRAEATKGDPGAEYLYDVLSMIGDMGQDIAGGILTGNPNVTLYMMGTRAAAGTYAGRRYGGEEPGAAGIASTYAGIVEPITEKIPMGWLMDNIPVFEKLMKVTFGEGLQEAASSVLMNAYDYASNFQNVRDMPFKDFLDQVKQEAGHEFLLGAGAGAGLAATYSAGEKLSQMGSKAYKKFRDRNVKEGEILGPEAPQPTGAERLTGEAVDDYYMHNVPETAPQIPGQDAAAQLPPPETPQEKAAREIRTLWEQDYERATEVGGVEAWKTWQDGFMSAVEGNAPAKPDQVYIMGRLAAQKAGLSTYRPEPAKPAEKPAEEATEAEFEEVPTVGQQVAKFAGEPERPELIEGQTLEQAAIMRLEAPTAEDRREGISIAPVTDRRTGDRRLDVELREKVAQMTPEEQYQAIYVDRMTGLHNRRAFEDLPWRPYLASIDVDSLKWVNDEMSMDAGDRMLAEVGRAIDQAIGDTPGVDGYHISGDEYYVQADTQEQADEILRKANEILETKVVEERGKGMRKEGINITWATDTHKHLADQLMKEEKVKKEAAGERAGRGEMPPGVAFKTPEDEAAFKAREEKKKQAKKAKKEERPKEKAIAAGKTDADLPAVKTGYTRLYRASSPTVKFEDVFDKDKLQKFDKGDLKGEYYTQDFNYADYFRETYGKDASLKYVDVPNDQLEGKGVAPGEYVLEDVLVEKPEAPEVIEEAPDVDTAKQDYIDRIYDATIINQTALARLKANERWDDKRGEYVEIKEGQTKVLSDIYEEYEEMEGALYDEVEEKYGEDVRAEVENAVTERQKAEGWPEDADIEGLIKDRTKGEDLDLNIPEQELDRELETRRRQQEAARARQKVNPEQDDILTAIAKLGGLSRESTGQFSDFHLQRAGNAGYIFRKTGGETPDGMAEKLMELGYPVTEDGVQSGNELLNQVDTALNTGTRIMSDRGIDPEMERRYEERQADLRAQAAEDGETQEILSWAEIIDKAYEVMSVEENSDIRENVMERAAIQEATPDEADAMLMEALQDAIFQKTGEWLEIETSQEPVAEVAPEVEGDPLLQAQGARELYATLSPVIRDNPTKIGFREALVSQYSKKQLQDMGEITGGVIRGTKGDIADSLYTWTNNVEAGVDLFGDIPGFEADVVNPQIERDLDELEAATFGLEPPAGQTVRNEDRQRDFIQEASGEAASEEKAQVSNKKPPTGGSTLHANPLGEMYKAWQEGADWVGRAVHNAGGWYFTPLKKLPQQKLYTKVRQKILGRVGNVERISKRIYTTFSKASEEDKAAVFKFLTDRDADPQSIADPDVRNRAIATKKLIWHVGKRLVDMGLLSEQAWRAHENAYLPRIYLRYVLTEETYRGLSAGKKPSPMDWARMRKDIPEEVRELIYGEIYDPAFLASRGLGVQMRDIVMLDFLGEISQNNEWIFEDALVDWNGNRVTVSWLQNEAEMIKKQAAYYTEEQKYKALAIVKQMESVLEPALESMGKMPADFKQIPDIKRYGRLRGMWVRNEIYNDILGSGTIVSSDASPAEMLLGYGGKLTKFTQFWKLSKVALNPPTQVRNITANMVLLNLSGVPLYEIPTLMARAINQITTNGKYWRIAKREGVTQATFANNELLRIRRDILDLEKRLSGKPFSFATFKNLAGIIADYAGDVYQFSESLGKTMKIMHAMEREGMSGSDAAYEANKWLYDYSMIPGSVRYLRNAPIGVPFITFYYKTLPRVAETFTKHPHRYLPYIIIPYLLAASIADDNDVEKEDIDKLLEALPDWLRERGNVYFLPYKDELGRWQAVDFGYFLPWSMFTEAGREVYEGKLGDAWNTVGLLGGPVPDLISAIKTNTDPFTRKEIVNKNDPPGQQAASIFSYLYRLAMPSWTDYEYGFAGRLHEAITGEVDPRTGDPQLTIRQAVWRFFGVNIYPTEPEETRKRNLQFMSYDINDTVRRMQDKLSNKNNTDEQKAKIKESYMELIEEKKRLLKEYKEKSYVHPNLKTGTQ